MVTLCDRCFDKGKQEYSYETVGSLFWEDLCEKCFKDWEKEGK